MKFLNWLWRCQKGSLFGLLMGIPIGFGLWVFGLNSERFTAAALATAAAGLAVGQYLMKMDSMVKDNIALLNVLYRNALTCYQSFSFSLAGTAFAFARESKPGNGVMENLISFCAYSCWAAGVVFLAKAVFLVWIRLPFFQASLQRQHASAIGTERDSHANSITMRGRPYS